MRPSHPPTPNQPGAPETRPVVPAGGLLCRAAGSAAGRNPKPSCALPVAGVPIPQRARSEGGRTARLGWEKMAPREVPAPPPAVSLGCRFGEMGRSQAPPSRVPAACLARGFRGPILTATQSQGKTQTIQHNETKKNPQRLLWPGLQPRATWGTRGPGQQVSFPVSSRAGRLREAQRPPGSQSPDPAVLGQTPPQQGVFLGKDASPSCHLPQPGLGDSIACPAQRGTGQPVWTRRLTPPTTPPWLAG